MTHGSLFNGIGGFQLAVSWMGWKNIFSVENDDFCNRVTKYHFPNCKQYGDIKTTDFSKYKGKIDILTGGFPCQPFSIAGKRLGAEDDRNLWGEMYRTIREVQPRWVVAENVHGVVNWNGGVVFEQVQADLEHEGYEVQSFILPAASVNAPHRRYRTWFVAYNSNTRTESMQRKGQNGVYGFKTFTNPNNQRPNNKQTGQSEQNLPDWDNFPTQSPVCSRNDGLSFRLDTITFPKWRRESVKALGNAVVPQVVLQIFESIKEYENQLKKTNQIKVKMYKKINKKYALKNSYFKNRLPDAPSNPYEVLDYYREHNELPYTNGEVTENWFYECFVEYQKRASVINNQFFTPPETAKTIAYRAMHESSDEDIRILDACCGYGQITRELQVYFNNISAFDNDKSLVNACRYFCDKSKVKVGLIDFHIVEDSELDCNFDMVISNPPYDNKQLPVFLEYLIEVLSYGGKAVLLLPCGFLDKTRPARLVRVLNEFKIESREPMTEKFARTNTSAEIVVLSK